MEYDSNRIVHRTVLLIVVKEEVECFGNVVEFGYQLGSTIHSPSGIDVLLFVIVHWDLECMDDLNR